MITTTICEPEIIFKFNPYLLMNTLERSYHHVVNEIIPYSRRKIRTQDIGKRKKFDKLLKEYLEVYERKTIEAAEYKAKIKEKAQKRPSFAVTEKTVRFKRIHI